MKLAIVGIGHIAKHQLNALNYVPENTLTDAYDIDANKKQLLAENVTFHPSLDHLLQHTNADFVLISTPNKTHYEIASEVLRSGHSAIVEKPCTNSLSEMLQLMDLAKDNNLILHTALHAKFANEVNWFLAELANHPEKYGQLSGFYAGFYDPYYVDGSVNSAALSLGGSWFDSGINALSVICQFINTENLQLVESHMTQIDGSRATQLQGNALFSFVSNGNIGSGVIDTNWTLNLNQKVTHLFYHQEGFRVTLDHSKQKVVIYKDNKLVNEVDCSTDQPKLTNHYINLFKDAYELLSDNQSNQQYSLAIHKLLYQAQ